MLLLLELFGLLRRVRRFPSCFGFALGPAVVAFGLTEPNWLAVALDQIEMGPVAMELECSCFASGIVCCADATMGIMEIPASKNKKAAISGLRMIHLVSFRLNPAAQRLFLRLVVTGRTIACRSCERGHRAPERQP